MPESKPRKKDEGSTHAAGAHHRGNPRAEAEAKAADEHKRPEPKKVRSRGWVAPTMLTLWGLGIAWIVVYYIAGEKISFMSRMGNWNLLVGMGLIALGFVFSTMWE